MSRFPKIATHRPLASLLATGAVAAALVLSTMSSAWAADAPSVTTPEPQKSATSPASDRDAPTGTLIRTHPKDLRPIVVYPGAMHASGDAQWADDDTSAPALPMARE